MAADIRAARGHRHRDGLDGVLARRDRREEAIARLVELIVVADAVERDVDERLRQAVDVGVAVDARGVHAGQERDRVQRVARRQRHVVDLIDVERGGDRGVLGVDEAEPPSTTTVSSSPPTSSVALTRAGMPGWSRTSSITAVLKPLNDTFTEYKARIECRHVKAPVPSVTALNFAAVDLLVTTTGAPGITAPAGIDDGARECRRDLGGSEAGNKHNDGYIVQKTRVTIRRIAGPPIWRRTTEQVRRGGFYPSNRPLVRVPKGRTAQIFGTKRGFGLLVQATRARCRAEARPLGGHRGSDRTAASTPSITGVGRRGARRDADRIGAERTIPGGRSAAVST